MVKNLIPVLPLRDIVVFPNMVAPLFVGREQSVNALNHVMTGDKKIFLLSQKIQKLIILIKKIFILLELLQKLFNY